jgi:hypothetical protein
MNVTAMFQLVLYMVFLNFSIMPHIQILIALYICWLELVIDVIQFVNVANIFHVVGLGG